MSTGHRGHDNQKWKTLSTQRVAIARANGEPCALCRKSIDYSLSGSHRFGPTSDHPTPLAYGGELLPPIEELRVVHRSCNSRQGAMIRNRGGRVDSRRAPLSHPARSDLAVPPRVTEQSQGVTGPEPVPGPEDPMWDVPWLDDLRDVPEDASWPRYMSAPHPNAVDSLGEEFEEWVKTNMRITLRWWQRLSARRLLEVDGWGALCWATYLQSVPRRGGKSVLLRALAYWRLHRAGDFEEPQLILLTGKDLPICKEIHRKAWPIAAAAGYDIRKQNGNEEIEHPDGSRWLVRGKDSVYGYDVCMGMVDEAWGVAPSVVDDGLEPALLERIQPQLVMTSTAHPKATTLMTGRMDAAIAQMYEPEDVLLMVWASDPNALPADRQAWRDASPHWTPQREKMLERTLQRLIDGTEDSAGIQDPAESFKAQYLNVWPVRRARQNEWVASEHLQACSVAQRPSQALPVAALEVSVDGSQWSVAMSDGQYADVLVGRSLDECVNWIQNRNPMEVLVHAAVESRLPSNLSLPTRRVTVGEAVAAAGALHQALTDHEIEYSSSEANTLTRQFTNVVTSAGPGGLRIGDRVSKGPVEAVKALSWAHWRASTNPPIPAAIF